MSPTEAVDGERSMGGNTATPKRNSQYFSP